MQIRSFQEVKIFKYTCCEKKGSYGLSIVFRDGSRTDAKSKMERFVLVINGWKPLAIVKKIIYTNVYIVFIYINVELLSNVDKRNILRSKDNNDFMFKKYDVSTIL